MRTILAVIVVLVLAGAGLAASAAYRQYREGAARIVAASSYRPAVHLAAQPEEGPLRRAGGRVAPCVGTEWRYPCRTDQRQPWHWGEPARPGTFTAALRSCSDGIAGAACRYPTR